MLKSIKKTLVSFPELFRNVVIAVLIGGLIGFYSSFTKFHSIPLSIWVFMAAGLPAGAMYALWARNKDSLTRAVFFGLLTGFAIYLISYI